VIIEPEAVDAPEALALLDALSEVLRGITGSSGRGSFDPGEMAHPRAVFVVAREDGVAVGCGALREVAADTAEIKRMYAATPGRGIGRAILSDLERRAREMGYRRVVVETRRCNEAAVRFYLRQGYAVGENYGRYRGRPEAVCFYKVLAP
jgi:putative acetyltransferase